MRTRVMTHALALSLALLLAACAAPRPAPASAAASTAAAAEPPRDYVNAGIYEAADPSNPAVRLVLFLSPNHGFILRHSLKKYGLVEYRGQWSSDPDSLRLSVYDVRRSPGADSARTVERLDTTISCPIASGSAQPLPLLRLISPKGGPRLITLAKPPEAPAWDSAAAKGKSAKNKKKKAKKPEGRTKTAKVVPGPARPGSDPKKEEDGKGKKEPTPAPAAAKTGA